MRGEAVAGRDGRAAGRAAREGRDRSTRSPARRARCARTRSPAEPERADLVDVVGHGRRRLRHVQHLDRGGAHRGRRRRRRREARQPRGLVALRRGGRAGGARRAHRPRPRERRGVHRRGRLRLPVRARRTTPRCATSAPVRRALGVRTIFNLLGPLANPAGARRRSSASTRRRWSSRSRTCSRTSASSARWSCTATAASTSSRRCGPCTVGWATPDGVRVETLDPLDLGIERCTIDELSRRRPGRERGADRARARRASPGRGSTRSLLNAGAALVVGGARARSRDGSGATRARPSRTGAARRRCWAGCGSTRTREWPHELSRRASATWTRERLDERRRTRSLAAALLERRPRRGDRRGQARVALAGRDRARRRPGRRGARATPRRAPRRSRC